MPDYDGGFKIAAHYSGRDLCRLAGIACDAWEPIGDTVQTTERLADRAFRARHGKERFVVYFEAYTSWIDAARWSILAKSALLSERERLPTVTLVFVLTPKRYRVQHGTVRLAVAGVPTQQVWFREICMWRERPEPWWEQVPGLMAMLPLCNHGLKEGDAVMYAARTIHQGVADTVDRANLLTTLAFFGKLASPGLKVLDLIGREQMRESKFFEEVMAEGRNEGKVQGLIEGKIEGQRAAVLDALEVRFGSKAAAEFAASLNNIKDLDLLAELHRLAIKSRGFAAFRQAFALLLMQ